jgi:hypothetical protein
MPAYARRDGGPAPFALKLRLQPKEKPGQSYLPGPTGSGALPPLPAPTDFFFGAAFLGAAFLDAFFCMTEFSSY